MMQNEETFWYWVNERHEIYLRRKGGMKRPWTADEILDKYKFCNVYRELDRVTLWVKNNIRDPYIDHPKLPALMGIARQINWPPTLQRLIDEKCLVPFNARKARTLVKRMNDAGQKVLTGAYLLTGTGVPPGWIKAEHIMVNVLGPLWAANIKKTDTVEEMWHQLKQFNGFGPFLSYQVCVDLSWTPWLNKAKDLNKFAAMGPGSKRGVKWLIGHKPNQSEALDVMRYLYHVQAEHRRAHVPKIRLSDIQNCLCEFDKYIRTVKGVSKPRTIFKETT